MFLKCLSFCRLKHTSSTEKQYPTIIEELCHRFSIADLRKCTNNFDLNKLIPLGTLSKVYKGCLQHNDDFDFTVAIKRFNADEIMDAYGTLEFNNEIELLCQLHHPNIISLIGFCNDENEKIIVFESMSNGSLYERLQGGDREALSWKKRLEICIGAARGLHYLHAGAKRTIIHRDIKPGNILLDDNMEPKLTGFGLSVQGQRFMAKPKPIKVAVDGTKGYVPVECFRDGTITDKTDVYSFGVVLLDVVCGGEKIINGEYFLDMPIEEIIEQSIRGKIAPECWQVFLSITERCMKDEADERPTMGEVEVELEHALSLQEQADITNTYSDYTLLSKTIINQNPGSESLTHGKKNVFAATTNNSAGDEELQQQVQQAKDEAAAAKDEAITAKNEAAAAKADLEEANNRCAQLEEHMRRMDEKFQMMMDRQSGAGSTGVTQVHPDYNEDLDEQPVDEKRCQTLKYH